MRARATQVRSSAMATRVAQVALPRASRCQLKCDSPTPWPDGQCLPDKQSSPMQEELAARPRRRQRRPVRRPVRRPRIPRRGFDEFEVPEAGPDEEVEIGGPVDDEADGG